MSRPNAQIEEAEVKYSTQLSNEEARRVRVIDVLVADVMRSLPKAARVFAEKEAGVTQRLQTEGKLVDLKRDVQWFLESHDVNLRAHLAKRDVWYQPDRAEPTMWTSATTHAHASDNLPVAIHQALATSFQQLTNMFKAAGYQRVASLSEVEWSDALGGAVHHYRTAARALRDAHAELVCLRREQGSLDGGRLWDEA